MAGNASVSFTLENQASGSAEAMASSLETLKSTIQSDVAELRAMQQAMRSLQGNTTEGAESIKTLGEQIAAQKSKISASSAEFIKLGGSFKNIKPPTEELAEGDDALKGFMDTAKGGLGPMGGLFERMNLLKAGGPAAVFIAATVALLALGAALVSVTIEMMKFSIASADAGLKQRLAFGSVANTAGVKELESMVSKLSTQLPNSTADIAKFAQEQYKAGLRGKELENATIAASMAAAGLGKDTKLGSERARQAMLPLETQMAKAKENWGKLFAGVHVEGAEKALKTVLDLLDENSSTGKALKAIFEGMMNPLFDSIAKGGPFFKAFFKEIVIMALMTAIAVKQVGNALSQAFGDGKPISGLEMISAGILAAKVVIGGIVVVVAAVIATFVALAAVFGGVLIVPIIAVVAVVGGLIAAFASAYSYLSSIDWTGIGSSIIDGLVGGIQSGAGAVIQAITNLAGNMTNSFKSALGIHSPSRMFKAEALHVPEGAAEGISEGAPMVEAAVADMVQVPAMAAPQMEGGGKQRAGSAGQIVFAPHIEVNGGGNAEELGNVVFEKMREVFVLMAQTYGLEPV